MFDCYQHESGQKVHDEVVQQLYCETRGQPGLVGWLGELLTEQFNKDRSQPIGMWQFNYAFGMAQQVVPSNNIMNIISKARDPAYRDTMLGLFDTGEQASRADVVGTVGSASSSSCHPGEVEPCSGCFSSIFEKSCVVG